MVPYSRTHECNFHFLFYYPYITPIYIGLVSSTVVQLGMLASRYDGSMAHSMVLSVEIFAEDWLRRLMRFLASSK